MRGKPWLPVCLWMQLKMLVITYKILHGIGPGYLLLVSTISAWSIQSCRVLAVQFLQLNSAIYQDSGNMPSLWQMGPIKLLFRRAMRTWLFTQIFGEEEKVVPFIFVLPFNCFNCNFIILIVVSHIE